MVARAGVGGMMRVTEDMKWCERWTVIEGVHILDFLCPVRSSVSGGSRGI
jgi:hypothetical protein